MNKHENSTDFNRREFIKSGSLAALMAVIGGSESSAQSTAAQTNSTPPGYTPIPIGPTVKFGVIGLGERGRDIIKNLALLPNTPITAVCDTYAASVRRASNEAPKAEKFDDYHALLASKEVDAVVVATPTHLHKQIVLDAFAAGKHVYCEAPLASSVEDAKAIASAAKAATKVVFQSGLQQRSHPQRLFLVPFIRGGCLGENAMARAQWHSKTSWRRSSSNPDHERDLNWRLDKATSLGLAGEIGIHQFDAVAWFMRERPSAVTGFGSLILWKDGRTVPDTVQLVFDFPQGGHLVYDATLCSSFEKAYEVYYGSDSTIMYRDEKAWLFKEVDAPLLGWEVYARKDQFYDETGIALVANATKQSAIGQSATANAFPYEPLYYALQAFTANVGMVVPEVKAYVDSYGDDLSALPETLAKLKTYPVAGWREGLDATLIAIKANEAVNAGQKVEIPSQLFEL